MAETTTHPEVRVQELHDAITQGLGAVAYMVGNLAHDARTFADLVGVEERLVRERGRTFNASASLRDGHTAELWTTLRAVDGIMERLGNYLDEPSEADMAATEAAFARVHHLLSPDKYPSPVKGE